MPGAYDAVLFDFGGVFTPSPFDAFHRVAEDLGVPADELVPLVFGPYHEDTDHPWHRLERGEVTIVQARDAIIEAARRRGHDFDPIQVLVAMAAAPPATRWSTACGGSAARATPRPW